MQVKTVEEYADEVAELFPDISREYLRNVIQQRLDNKPGDPLPVVVNTLMSLDGNYPKSTGEAEPGAPEVTEVKEVKKDVDDMMNTLKTVFTDAATEYLAKMLTENLHRDDPIGYISAHMLDSGYDKKKKKKPLLRRSSRSNLRIKKESVYDTSKKADRNYTAHTMCQLANTFPRMRISDLKKIATQHNFKYVPTFKQVKVEYASFTLMKKERMRRNFPEERNDQFFAELEYLQTEQSVEDEKFAKELNETEYEQAGQLIECGCCYCDYPFDDFVQCYEGHLICKQCVKQYIETSVFGQAQTTLHCLDPSGCKERYPREMLGRVLEKTIFSKLEKRLQTLELQKAGLENYHTCPICCEYGAIIENKDEKVFRCGNTKCLKETCILCKEENHIPLRCDEVEKKGQAEFRKTVEEEMSEAMIRVCPKCNSKFFKTDGCNKITCQCGVYMCYVCREVIPKKEGYNHFCKCDRNPQTKLTCPKCDKCFLFFKSTAEHDASLVEKAKKTKLQEAKERDDLDIDAVEDIGITGKKRKNPPLKKKTKKRKIARNVIY